MAGHKQLSAIYRFLARAMRYPEKSCLKDNFPRLSNLLESLGWQAEMRGLQPCDAPASKAFEDLQVEYTRLFINSLGGVLAPPYGSVYLSKSGALFNEATEAVKKFYHQQGFTLADNREVADHIVNELEFLALLAANNMMTVEISGRLKKLNLA